jgi:hypothetical protein
MGQPDHNAHNAGSGNALMTHLAPPLLPLHSSSRRRVTERQPAPRGLGHSVRQPQSVQPLSCWFCCLMAERGVREWPGTGPALAAAGSLNLLALWQSPAATECCGVGSTASMSVSDVQVKQPHPVARVSRTSPQPAYTSCWRLKDASIWVSLSATGSVVHNCCCNYCCVPSPLVQHDL